MSVIAIGCQDVAWFQWMLVASVMYILWCVRNYNWTFILPIDVCIANRCAYHPQTSVYPQSAGRVEQTDLTVYDYNTAKLGSS